MDFIFGMQSPNVIGLILGILQMSLYAVYRDKNGDVKMEVVTEKNDQEQETVVTKEEEEEEEAHVIDISDNIVESV